MNNFDPFDDDLDAELTCPACSVTLAWEEFLMGALGNRAHYRCPHCNAQWSAPAGEEG